MTGLPSDDDVRDTPTVNGGYVYKETIEQDGATVLDHLVVVHTHSDAPTWATRIAAGEVTLDGAVAVATSILQAGQVLCWHKPPWVEPAVPTDVVVIAEDEAMLAVHKPAGLPTLPGSGYLDNTLLTIVRRTAPTASPVHRLDRGTSGIVLFAKDAEAARAIQRQWDAGAVAKAYRAVVEGVVVNDETIVTAPIDAVTDAVVGQLFVASVTGKRARSTLRVVERRSSTTLVDVVIDTGRPHQIRIHAAFTGYPLVDDPVYGVGGGRRPGSQARPGDIGFHLHAHTLELRHPRSGEHLRLVAPPPAVLTSTSTTSR